MIEFFLLLSYTSSIWLNVSTIELKLFLRMVSVESERYSSDFTNRYADAFFPVRSIFQCIEIDVPLFVYGNEMKL